ncbi:PREDICTED: serine/threonine-protein kinase VRK1-like isoform X1 [Acropora digitifera]|uniref:serine/threonine-protein kinase VRK1-like isoform X1 n=1 Tax=Acropora digitifera TaxID=70779 RepID=UPI00077A6880|nr:PREDICTED: serine/threonine-protein kinase VRK1-like isoform X1 [Acropora digitifera]
MSPRKRASGKRRTATTKAPMATKKRRKPRRMVELPEGLKLTDLTRKKWRIGSLIGQGGFGALYLASPENGTAVDENAEHVIKVEHAESGPLFTEVSFYQRVAEPKLINNWCKSKKLRHLGVPMFFGTGLFHHGSTELRFLVMERFGKDVDKLFTSSGRKFDVATVLMLGLRVLDALECIHFHEYTHGDIKGSNLIMGFSESKCNQVYLLDYGLVYRFNPEGNHEEYKVNPKRKHDGTLEFTCRDAHNGVVTSRRGDLEILGYVMLQWLCGRLPWENNLANKEYVGNEKMRYMKDIPRLMRDCFCGNHPVEIQRYLEYVSSLKYQQEPDYEHIRKLLKDGLKKRGCTDDGKSVKFTPPACASPATADVCNGHDSEEETQDRSARRRPASRQKRRSERLKRQETCDPLRRANQTQ